MQIQSPIPAGLGHRTLSTSNWLPYVATLGILAILMGGVSALPPLTQSSTPLVRDIQFRGPLGDGGPGAYCRANLTGVNCGCFAQKAEEVLSAPRHVVAGLVYADRWELARFQASKSC